MNYGMNSNLQSALKTKMTLFFLGMLLLEVGAFVGVSWLIGFANTCWLTFGISVLGYLILQFRSSQNFALSVVAWLLMIPGFILDIMALIVAIKPLRQAIRNRILSKFLPPEVMQSFAPESSARFADFMRGMGGMGANCRCGCDMGNAGANCNSTCGANGGSNRCSSRASGDVIDIDEGADGYEVKYSGRHDVVMKKATTTAPKSIAAEEIIDVEHEWK